MRDEGEVRPNGGAVHHAGGATAVGDFGVVHRLVSEAVVRFAAAGQRNPGGRLSHPPGLRGHALLVTPLGTTEVVWLDVEPGYRMKESDGAEKLDP